MKLGDHVTLAEDKRTTITDEIKNLKLQKSTRRIKFQHWEIVGLKPQMKTLKPTKYGGILFYFMLRAQLWINAKLM